MLNNVTCKEDVVSVKNHIKKLKVADSLFTNKNIKNSILHNIAFMYLLEDQNISNNKTFLDEYFKLSTDKESKIKIQKIGNSIQVLAKSKKLPNVELINVNGAKTNTINTNGRKTVIFFWTSDAKSHMETAHKRVAEIQIKHPKLNFIGINIDDSLEDWKKTISKYNFKTNQLHSANFEEIKDKWVITKIHRAMIINADGNIDNAFVNIFDANFEKHLE